MVSVVIHTNTRLKNQLDCADWLKAGFARHGVSADVTPDRTKAADIHVVQGPHYCLDYWLPRSDTQRVLWLNRTYYGDPYYSISLGWLRPDGSRDFRNAGAAVPKGTLPVLKRSKDGRRSACFFADYGRDPRPAVSEWRQKWNGSLYFRPHPQQNVSTSTIALTGPLADVWALCDTAIGHSTTTLVEARIEGLHVECSDPHNPAGFPGERETWLQELSWTQWTDEELKRGDFWNHLQ